MPQAKNSSFSMVYPASIAGLIAAVSFEWIYFDGDASRQYMHALRRNVFTGFFWSLLHLPLHLSLVASGAGLKILIYHIGANSLKNHASKTLGTIYIFVEESFMNLFHSRNDSL
jgi:low temperature requirement protein LtrA